MDYRLIEAELLFELREAIRGQPEQCGKVNWLIYMDSLSGKEIAETRPELLVSGGPAIHVEHEVSTAMQNR